MDFKTKPKIGICPSVPPRKSSQLSNSNLHQLNSSVLWRSSSESNKNWHTESSDEHNLSTNQENMFSCLGKSGQLCDGRSSVRGPNPNPPSYSPISPIRTAQQFPWISNGSTPEVLKARAIAPFHDQNGGYQLLNFNEGDIIGVFADSLNSKEDTGWWRGFRFANGPSGGIGMFPANRVSLFPMPYQQKQPQVTSAAQLQLNERKGKIDFCVQADVASNCSSSDEDDESETNDSSGTSQKAEISTISSGIDETPPQNDFNGLQKADDLVPSAMPVPLRSPMLNASASMAIEPGHTSNLLINSSNRNSATSLDSGRGSAYATSSEGLKMIATSMSATFINPSGCPLQPVDIHTPLRMAPPPATPAHSRMGSIRAAASHLPSSISSAPSSASSSGISSCSSTCTANSGERSQVELLVNWLLTAGFSDYTPCIVAAGYDLNTLRRATPEDLNACGVTNPRDRQQLRARLSRLQLPESLPDHVPSGIFEWLSIINLTNYWPTFQAQGLTTFEKIIVLTWEDFEEIGVTKLGHQKKLLLAIERLRRVMSKRSEEQNHGTDSLNRSLQHQISLSPHQALRSASLVEDREIGRLNEITPPPPPRFQDPPKLTRKISIDCPTSINSPDHHRISHHKYFSTSFLADFGRLGVGNSNPSDIIGEGSTKSDPLPITDGLDIRDKEREKESRKDQHSKEVLDDSVLSARQRHKNAAAAAVPIPVSVANQMIPPPTSGATMDKDLQDMQDIRSMLDKLSEHLTSRGSP